MPTLVGTLLTTTGSPAIGVGLRFTPLNPGVYPNGDLAAIISGVSVLTNAQGKFSIQLPQGVEFVMQVLGHLSPYQIVLPKVETIDLADVLFPVPQRVRWFIHRPGFSPQEIQGDSVNLATLPNRFELSARSFLSNQSSVQLNPSALDWDAEWLDTPGTVTYDPASQRLIVEKEGSSPLRLTSIVMENPSENMAILYPQWVSSDPPYWVDTKPFVVSPTAAVMFSEELIPEIPEAGKKYSPSTGLRSIQSSGSPALTGQEAGASILEIDLPYGGNVYLPEATDIELDAPAQNDDTRVSTLVNRGGAITLYSSPTIRLLDDSGFDTVETVAVEAGDEVWVLWLWQDDLAAFGTEGESGWVVSVRSTGKSRFMEIEDRLARVTTFRDVNTTPLSVAVLPDESGRFHIVDDSSSLSYLNAPLLDAGTPAGWNAHVINVSGSPLELRATLPQTLEVPAGHQPKVLPDGTASLTYLGSGKWSATGDLLQAPGSASLLGEILRAQKAIGYTCLQAQSSIIQAGTYVLSETTPVTVGDLRREAAIGGGLATVTLVNDTSDDVPISAAGSWADLSLPDGRLPAIIPGGIVRALFLTDTGKIHLTGDLLLGIIP